mgnify:FL=1
MDLNYSIENIFPTPIHVFDINRFDEIRDSLIDYAYDLRKKEPISIGSYENEAWNYCHPSEGWQSPRFNVNNKNDLLQNYLITALTQFSSIKETVGMRVSTWMNINPKNTLSVKHDHPCSDLAGVLWVKCSKNCGRIVFDNSLNFQSFNEINSYTDKFKERTNYYHNYFFNPIEGRMIIFPSHLQHHVEVNKSEEDRISISFNINLCHE